MSYAHIDTLVVGSICSRSPETLHYKSVVQVDAKETLKFEIPSQIDKTIWKWLQIYWLNI